MPPIVHTVEIARPPEDVFAYIDDVARHPEWQPDIVSVTIETEGPMRVGSRVREVRRMGSREMAIPWEVTEREPPRRFAFRGVSGPVRATGRGTVEPVADGSRSRVTFEMELTGHGFGKLIVPFVRRQAAKQVPLDQARLKERLEGGA